MKLSGPAKILFLIAVSIFVFFLFSESIFFLTGQYLLWSRRHWVDYQNNYIRIVCIGDSHTFGVGSSRQYSYPKQLEILLNYNNISNKFIVLNLGIPGAATKTQIEELEKFFENAAAKIVILLTGRNNFFELRNWGNEPSLSEKEIYHIRHLRSIRFLKEAFRYITKLKKETIDTEYSKQQTYEKYLNYYLERAKELCSANGAKLILLSYYNSSDDVVRDFARRNDIPYFDFTEDFQLLFNSKGKTQYVSPDGSHMNHSGYRYFAEKLYQYLFLYQDYINLKINPLFKKIEDTSFYKNEEDVEKSIELQKNRIEQFKGTIDYSFELIQLGHIYTEIDKKELAKQAYMEGLISSDYLDNNTIVTPIINWYLENGTIDDALYICDEIISHSSENKIAKHYRDWLISNLQKVKF